MNNSHNGHPNFASFTLNQLCSRLSNHQREPCFDCLQKEADPEESDWNFKNVVEEWSRLFEAVAKDPWYRFLFDCHFSDFQESGTN